MRTLEGNTDGAGLRIAIVAARFNERITTRLAEGAVETARASGVAEEAIDLAWVPGAFEIPLAARRFARTGNYDAIVCLGAVIRGETPHFDFVAGEAARGVSDVARDCDIPVSFGVITTDTVQQARARSERGTANKGHQAMVAAIQMATLLAQM